MANQNQPVVYIAPTAPLGVSIDSEQAVLTVTIPDQPALTVVESGAAGLVNSVNGRIGDVPVLGPLVSQLTYGAVVTINAAVAGHFILTLAGDATLANPANALINKQRIVVEVIQGTTGSHHLSYGSEFNFGTAIGVPVLSTAPGKRDFLAFIYDSGLSVWDCVGFVWGY